ncbi:efflux RND transporter periplasmic adaptor subunit [Zhouia sp. PK063]|uniref:efflux RND transporter periplasmic adaptor subunit n=1 Tax=Zhouia sp. PK063 TaxID=3373602 RepID=UPI00379A87A8
MKNYIIYTIRYLLLLGGMVGCTQATKNTTSTHAHEATAATQNEHSSEGFLTLTSQEFEALGLQADTLPKKPMSQWITANGQLEVPPQNEASVTAVVGANIKSIKVMEGDQVHQGMVLGYMQHPDLIKLQTNYLKAFHRLNYLEKEYLRQQKLYENHVASGQTFEQASAAYQSKKAEVQGLTAALQLLHINTSRLQQGNLYQQLPIISPINGYVEQVHIQVGQYVQPQNELFHIVNTEHIHADLMIYEKDVPLLRKEQLVKLHISALPDTLKAKIYAIGKTFEQQPKAVHVHADLAYKTANLLPGMYVKAKIATSTATVTALPEEAIVTEQDATYIFTATPKKQGEQTIWHIQPLAVTTLQQEQGWVGISLPKPLASQQKVLLNNAYYLMAELKKSETSHDH